MGRLKYGPDSIRALPLERRIEMLERYREGGEGADEVALAFGLRSAKMVVTFARNHTTAELTLKRLKIEEARQAAAERKANPPKPVREQAVVVRQRVAVPVAVVKICGTRAEPKPPHPVLATKGKWQELEAYAAANGITRIEAQKLWHKERVGAV